MVPATTKGEATRAFLLRTAADVFAANGYVSTTLADLIAASGLTKGAFYFYFRSKSALAVAVLEDAQQRWLRRIADDVGAAGSPAQQLRTLLPAMLALLADEPGAWSITRLTSELSADPEVGPQMRARLNAWVDFVADIVRRGQQVAEVRGDLDPRAVAVVLVGAFNGLKALTDVLDSGPVDESGPTMDVAARSELRTSPVFTDRARTLLALIDQALLTDGATQNRAH